MATRISFFTLSTAALMLSAAVSTQAAEVDANLVDKAALSDDELSGMRGGFLTAGGAQFDFGASIKTMVNGQIALQTSLQYTNTGPVTQQVAGLGQSIRSQVNNVVASSLGQAGIASPIGNNTGAPSDVANTAAGNVVDAASNAAGAAAAPIQAAAATAAGAATNTASPAAGSAPSTASPTVSPTVSGPAVATGVEIPGVGGSTQVFANLSPSQIQSIILNSASGQSITQNTDITFTIYNFQAWQQQLAERTVAVRLASEMLAASGFATGH